MKFNFIFFSIFILYSCTPLPPTLNLDKTYSAKGLAYIKCNDINNIPEGLQSPLIKFLDENILKNLLDFLQVKNGDIIFF